MWQARLEKAALEEQLRGAEARLAEASQRAVRAEALRVGGGGGGGGPGIGAGGDAEYFRNVLLSFLEMRDADERPLLEVIARCMGYTEADMERVFAARARQQQEARGSLGGLGALFTAPRLYPPARRRPQPVLTAAFDPSIRPRSAVRGPAPSATPAAPAAQGSPSGPAAVATTPMTGMPETPAASTAAGEGAQPEAAAEEAAAARAEAVRAEARASRLASELERAREQCAAAEDRLTRSDAELRRQSEAGGGVGNLPYLRHVLTKYIELGDGEESDALFQVQPEPQP